MPEDLGRLREQGLSDAEILDVILAAAARCFFSSVLAAVGAVPDARYDRLDPDLPSALAAALTPPDGDGPTRSTRT